MNILVITSKYPSPIPVKGFTPIVHYFAKEWVKQGHQVKVIHNQSKFPYIFFLIPGFFRKFLENKFGFSLPYFFMQKEMNYELDAVKVHRIPIFRAMPFINYFSSNLNSQVGKIIKSNEKDNFNPDIIVGHFNNPQLYIGANLKEFYSCKFSLVIHSVDRTLKQYEPYLQDVDILGFRSRTIQLNFESLYRSKNSFICHSGVDENRISVPKSIKGNITKFIFVGILIRRKNVRAIINMLNFYNDLESFNFDVIGSGPESDSLKSLSEKCRLNNQITFHGYQKREHIFEKLEQSECFIMISENEVFGLVYLEAMAKGCIVIAAKNEGMDGIIINGFNGFLCVAGDSKDLMNKINDINGLSREEKFTVSKNAIITAKKFSEREVAINYIKNIETI